LGTLERANFNHWTNSVNTSLETHHVSTAKPNRFALFPLFAEPVTVYFEGHAEHNRHTAWAVFGVIKGGGAYGNHWALKRYYSPSNANVRIQNKQSPHSTSFLCS
jgi:hypothetical protein